MRIRKSASIIIIIMMSIFTICSFTNSSSLRTFNYEHKEYKNSTVFSEALRIEERIGTDLNSADPFQLSITNQTINQNITYLTIQELSILFENGTDIAYGSAEDYVTLLIFNDRGFNKTYKLGFSPEVFSGWGINVHISDYYPGVYYVDLFVETEAYYYSGRIHSFEITFEVHFQYSYLFINNELKTMALLCGIMIGSLPWVYNHYVMHNSEIYGFIYNSSYSFIKKVTLEISGMSGFSLSWYSNFSIADFEEGYYHAYVMLIFDGKTYPSDGSNVVFFGEETTETGAITPIWTITTIAILSIIVSFRQRKRESKKIYG